MTFLYAAQLIIAIRQDVFEYIDNPCGLVLWACYMTSSCLRKINRKNRNFRSGIGVFDTVWAS